MKKIILGIFALVVLLLNPVSVLADKALTPDEQAVRLLNNSLLIDQVAGNIKEEDKNIFTPIKDKVTGLIKSLSNLLGFNPASPETLLPRASLQQQSKIPPQLEPKKDLNPIEKIKNLLGGNASVYGATLPSFEQTNKKADDWEKSYQQANFPDGINPITR